MSAPPPRLKPWIRVDAHRARAEAAGASVVVERQGCREAGAIAVKLVATGRGFGAPAEARALMAATLGDGASGWSWLAGPAPAPEAAVDEKLARAARADPDLWIVTIEDREGRHFLEEPVAEG